ncbi:MAG: iron ABC transporter permease [Pseudomonadota bacterium]
MKNNPRSEGFILASAYLPIALLCGLPLILLFLQIFALPDEKGSLAGFLSVVGSGSVLRAAWQSLESSLLSALFATFVGTLLAFAVGLTDIRRKGLIVFLLLLPMMIPPHVTAIAWIQALGPGSVVLKWLGIAPELGTTHPLYSRGGLVTLLTIQHMPLTFLLLRAGLRAMPKELTEAGRMAGAGPLRLMIRVQLPLLAPTILGAFMLAFVAALGNFGINALIGIPARYVTLPVLIWQRLASFGPDVLGEMAIVAVLLAVLTVVALIVMLTLQRTTGHALIGPPSTPLSYRLGGWRPVVELSIWLFLAAVLLLPGVSLLATALVPTYGVPLTFQTLTLDNLSEVVWSQAVTARAFMNSTLLASLAAVLIAAFSIFVGYGLVMRGGLSRHSAVVTSALSEISFAVPGIVMSIAFILVFIRPLPFFEISLYGTAMIIFLAYLAVFFTIGLKPVVAAYTQLDKGLEEAAKTAGAHMMRRMIRIFLPLVAPAAVSGAILVFLTAYNEVTVSALLWSSGNETIGTVIFNYEDGGYTTLAAAMSVVVVIATALIMVASTFAFRNVPPGTIPWRD